MEARKNLFWISKQQIKLVFDFKSYTFHTLQEYGSFICMVEIINKKNVWIGEQYEPTGEIYNQIQPVELSLCFYVDEELSIHYNI